MKNIVYFIPLYTAILITMGYGWLRSYYNIFGIPIESYITLQEVIILFFPVIFGVIAFLQFLVQIFPTLMSRLTVNSIDTDVLYKSYFLTVVGYGFSLSIIGLLIFSLLDILCIFYKSDAIMTRLLNYLQTLFLFAIALFGALRFVSFRLFKKQYLYWLHLIIVPFYFAGLNWQSNLARSIKEHGNATHVTFVYKNQVYKAPQITYIGQTHDFIFMYNKEGRNSLIIPKSEISLFSIKI